MPGWAPARPPMDPDPESADTKATEPDEANATTTLKGGRVRRLGAAKAAAMAGANAVKEGGSLPSTPPAPVLSMNAKFAASMKALVSKVYGSHFGGSEVDGAAAAGTAGSSSRRKGGAAGGGNRRQKHSPEAQVQVWSEVKLPSAPTQMFVSTSKGASGLIERVLLSEGYMRSDLLKILDQLPHFQRRGKTR